jgi:CRISPR-associated protein Csd1
MILHSLFALCDRLEGDGAYQIAPPGYSLQKITYRVVLTPEGRLFEIQDARHPEGKALRPQLVFVPGDAKPPGSSFNPCFLWDNTGYLLGYKPEDENPERTSQSFDAFREKHLGLEHEINSGPFSAVCRFLEAWNPIRAEELPVLKELTTGFGVFQIQGERAYVHQDLAVREWWRKQCEVKESGQVGQCLITGQTASLARLHPKIKRVSGAQGAGATLVSFNDVAYESYGKSQSFNAPVSEEAASRYGLALNALLDGPMSHKHRFQIGDATVAFWTDRPSAVEDFFVQFAERGSEGSEGEDAQDQAVLQKLSAFLDALRKGKEAYGSLGDDPEVTRFFLLGLTGQAGGRIGVRFFLQGSLRELLENLRAHYSDTAVQRQASTARWKGDPEFPSLRQLLDQTCPKKEGRADREKIPPILEGPLLRAVLAGTHYPQGLYAAVLRRIHADREVIYLRACILKGYLNRNLGKEVSMSLDTERQDPAYRLGRLFAALEKTQKDALGDNLNATIRDRFYSSASATPRSVFPRLLRTYQHHLSGLDGGRKVTREKLVQEILAPLGDFPAHLDLAGQGLFALGYYHQTKTFYQKKENLEPETEPEGDN